MNICRTGDVGVGICTAHKKPIPMTGILLATSAMCLCDGIPVGLQNDIVLGSCGHVGVIVSSAGQSIIEGRGIVRTSDSFVGSFSGVMVTGSSLSTAQ